MPSAKIQVQGRLHEHTSTVRGGVLFGDLMVDLSSCCGRERVPCFITAMMPFGDSSCDWHTTSDFLNRQDTDYAQKVVICSEKEN